MEEAEARNFSSWEKEIVYHEGGNTKLHYV